VLPRRVTAAEERTKVEKGRRRSMDNMQLMCSSKNMKKREPGKMR